MTSRRIAELAALLMLAVAILFALPMKAQSYPAKQLYLPYVAHLGAYSTDLTLTNFTPDRISVSYAFIRANASDDDRGKPLLDYHVGVRRLDPRQSMTVEIGELGITGQGMLVVEACKVDALCWETIAPGSDPQSPRFIQNTDENAIRTISVSARIYVTGTIPMPGSTATLAELAAYRALPVCARLGGTCGDSMAAVPWYAPPGADMAGTDKDRVSIVGVRSDGHYGTQIGLVNGSQYSETILTTILHDGSGAERGRWTEHFGPLESVKRDIGQMFPLAFMNRLNRQPPITSPWVTVQQTLVTPNDLAARTVGCENGCPRFMAYASVTDSLSGDFSIVPASFDVADRSRTGEPLPPSMVPGGDVHSAAFHPATLQASPLCRVVGPNPHDGSWTIWRQKPGGKKDELELVTKAASGQFKMAQAACSGAMGQ